MRVKLSQKKDFHGTSDKISRTHYLLSTELYKCTQDEIRGFNTLHCTKLVT